MHVLDKTPKLPVLDCAVALAFIKQPCTTAAFTPLAIGYECQCKSWMQCAGHSDCEGH